MRYEDKLRQDLHTVLMNLKLIRSKQPDERFLEEFRQEGFFFIHTVKCWIESKYPGFGRDKKNRARRNEIGLPLLKACVATHLQAELNAVAPAKVCALGELAFQGLCILSGNRWDKKFRATPTEGRIIGQSESGFSWPLLYTCLPVGQKVPVNGTRKFARELVESHLSTFMTSC